MNRNADRTVQIGWNVRAVDPTGNEGVREYSLTGHKAAAKKAAMTEYYDMWGWTYTFTPRMVSVNSREFQLTH